MVVSTSTSIVLVSIERPNGNMIQKAYLCLGRSGRIGNKGIATSFYNDKNEDLAEGLVRVLLETKQAVPDFLKQYIPEGGEEAPLDFDDESDNEGEGEEAEAAETTNEEPEQVANVAEASESQETWTPNDDAWGAKTSEAPAVAAW